MLPPPPPPPPWQSASATNPAHRRNYNVPATIIPVLRNDDVNTRLDSYRCDLDDILGSVAN